MQRNRFLGDLLSTLFERRGSVQTDHDHRNIFELCEALLSAEGEVSGLKIATSILGHYRSLTNTEKFAFFQFLNTSFDVDADAIADCATAYGADRTAAGFARLSRAAEPKRQELLRRLNQPLGATADIVAMRVDLLRMLPSNPELARTDFDFTHLFRSWFNRGFLVLHDISWDTPARILDKIVAYEAVHQINDWDDLRRRLYPPDRRCFAFFHPAMPEEPLIFVEVALTEDIPGSIDALLSAGRSSLEAEAARTAVFYSISNCQKGLTGVNFGNLLIKQVVAELLLTLPQIKTFVTLSPIPGLTRWLKTQTEDEALGARAIAALTGTADSEDLRGLAARYLLKAKREDGRPLDPVTRFHLGNGAQIYDVHAEADRSENGRGQSCGVMVNYLYDLTKTERQHENFALKSIVAAAKPLRTLAAAVPKTTPKEVSS